MTKIPKTANPNNQSIKDQKQDKNSERNQNKQPPIDLRNSLDPETFKREKHVRKKSFKNPKQKSTISLASYAMLLGSIGKGSFSEVYKGKLVGTGKMVAIK